MPPENPHKTTDTAGQTPLGAMRRRTVITGAAGVGVGAVAGASAHALLSPPRSDMSVPGRKPADIALTDARQDSTVNISRGSPQNPKRTPGSSPLT